MKKAIAILLSLMLCLALPCSAEDTNKSEDLKPSDLRSESAILINADTGEVLFEKDADVLRYPASTTKIMTLLLAITMGGDLDRTIVTSQSALDIQDENGAYTA